MLVILGVVGLIVGFERLFVRETQRPQTRGRSFLRTTTGRIALGFAVFVVFVYVVFVAVVSGQA